MLIIERGMDLSMQFNLFNDSPDEKYNLLPYDGEVNYFGKIFSDEESEMYMQKLLNEAEWKNDEAKLYGKQIITRRKYAWYGDDEFSYTYSGVTRRALLWNAVLLELKCRIEERCGERFNSCLLNLYHNGQEGMAWHQDAEKDLVEGACIASLSFGTGRIFSFRHLKRGTERHVLLENGSLLLMKGATQKHWLHRLPTDKKVKGPRVNLTFRSVRLK